MGHQQEVKQERLVILDTETTGINPREGHRIVEIGCVEMVNRQLTGRSYHAYINPQFEMEQEVIDVHGLTNEFLTSADLAQDVLLESSGCFLPKIAAPKRSLLKCFLHFASGIYALSQET